MRTEIVESMNEAGQAAIATVKEVVALNNATLETLVEKQLEVVAQLVDLGVRQGKLVAEAKDAQAAFAAQVGLVEDAAEQAMDNARDLVAIFNSARTAYDKLIDKGVKGAVAKLQPVPAKKAA